MGNVRNIAFWVILFVLILMLFNLFSDASSSGPSTARSYSEFVDAVEGGNVQDVTLDGEQVRFVGSDGKSYVVIKPSDAEVTDLLIKNDIPVTARPQ